MSEFEKDLLNMILMLKHRPALYLGSHSISKFRTFIDGFRFGYSFPKIHQSDLGFQKFIEKKYRPNSPYGTAEGWNNILLGLANDEAKALDLFFVEFETFLNEENIEIPKKYPELTAIP